MYIYVLILFKREYFKFIWKIRVEFRLRRYKNGREIMLDRREYLIREGHPRKF